MTITPLPTPPQSSNSATFNADADAFLAALPTFQAELNAFGANLSGSFVGSSSTSVSVGTGSKSFTANTGAGWVVGQPLSVGSASAPTNYMIGQVTSYNTSTGALVMNMTGTGGSGAHSDWVIAPVGYTAGQIPATATNDDAMAGNLGEYWAQDVPAGSAISLTTGSDANVTSKSIPAGDWDIDASITFLPTSISGWVLRAAAISGTSAVRSPSNYGNFLEEGSFSGSNGRYAFVGRLRVSLASATTLYLVARGDFSGGSLKAAGQLVGRRAR